MLTRFWQSVLIAGTKSKKSNRRNIIEQAQGRAVTLVNSFLDGPIAAIETTDHVMDMLQETRLSDPEVCLSILVKQ
jgi:translation initiation factor 2-alpha kinase 4